MKKIFTKLVIILIIAALYFVFISAFNRNDNATVSQASSPDPYKFDNIIMNTDYRIVQSGNGGLWIGNNLDRYKELGFNAVHVYPYDNDVYGQFPILLTYPQKQNNADLIRSVKESGLNFFYEHTFFSYLCYAQRLVYLIHKPGETNQTNNGFCYQTANGTLITQPGNDTTVLYVQQQQNPQYTLVCGDIYENLQHSDYFSRQHDKDVDWYVKPMMKLDASNLSDDTPIFRIVYFNFNGDSIGGETIKAYNFKHQGVYNGDYIDKFYDENGNPKVFSVSGDETTTSLNYGRPSGIVNKEACHVDFKIYTYGQANFWLKKVTVDDFYANNLYNNVYDDLIQNELQYIGSDPNLYSYYMDEQTYSQLPCIKYVMDKIDEYNQANNTNIKFMVAGSNWQAVNMYRKMDFGHTLTLNALHPRILYIFSYEMYECSGVDHTYIPVEALGSNNIDSRIKTEWKANYNTYNNYLQNFVLGDKNSGYTSSHPQGSFIYQVALAKNNIINISPESRLMVGAQLQGEMWMEGNYLTGISSH